MWVKDEALHTQQNVGTAFNQSIQILHDAVDKHGHPLHNMQWVHYYKTKSKPSPAKVVMTHIEIQKSGAFDSCDETYFGVVFFMSQAFYRPYCQTGSAVFSPPFLEKGFNQNTN